MNEITKAQIKLIKSLDIKKNRIESGLFVAEGEKTIVELIKRFECQAIFKIPTLNFSCQDIPIININNKQLDQISFLKHPQGIVGVFKLPLRDFISSNIQSDQLILALDEVQDPGNLGTIIRTADWFGIKQIVCSANCADCFNPKVVQATMGALARVDIFYTDLVEWLSNIRQEIPIYGTLLNGQDIYHTPLSTNGIIIMGNEGNGISSDLHKLISKPLLIPNYPVGQETSESLNVGIATALVCSEFRRRMVQNPIKAS